MRGALVAAVAAVVAAVADRGAVHAAPVVAAELLRAARRRAACRRLVRQVLAVRCACTQPQTK